MQAEDKNQKMALACAAVSVLGIAILFISTTIDDAQKVKIGAVGSSMAGERALLCGTVRSIHDNGKDTVFMNLSDESGSISAVFFKDVKEKTDGVPPGAGICVEGNIQIYRGLPEIIGRKLQNSTK